MKFLKVIAVGDALVQDYLAMRDAHIRRYIGRKYDASVGPNGGWVSTERLLRAR